MKQLMSIALLTLILSSCQKDVPELPNNVKEVKTNNIPPPPPGTITLQTVVLHSRIDITFGWENNGSFQNQSASVHNITSGIGGGNIGGNVMTWQQGLTFWSNEPANPDVINMVVTGTYTYIATGSWGADRVKEAIIIQIFYNTRTKTYTTVVSRTNSTLMNIR